MKLSERLIELNGKGEYPGETEVRNAQHLEGIAEILFAIQAAIEIATKGRIKTFAELATFAVSGAMPKDSGTPSPEEVGCERPNRMTDTERLDFLIDNTALFFTRSDERVELSSGGCDGCSYDLGVGKDARAAIDAAILASTPTDSKTPSPGSPTDPC